MPHPITKAMLFTGKASATKKDREIHFSKMDVSSMAKGGDKMEKACQDVLDGFPYGIYLVTISAQGGYNGMISSWVTQCSHEPPLLSLAIRKNRLSREQILETNKFCINVLSREAAGMIRQFKIADWTHKFDACGYKLSAKGLPVANNCIGYLDCSLERAIDLGDHTLFIGTIIAGAMKNAAKPLRYRRTTMTASIVAQNKRSRIYFAMLTSRMAPDLLSCLKLAPCLM